MKTITLKTDIEIKTDVLAELKFDPSVNLADIGVLVKDGAVTLNGFATSYPEKWGAVQATKRVAGVRAIADDIAVKTPHSGLRTDGDIAGAAANQITWFTSIPPGAAKVTVSDGWVTLEGEVEWGYQKTNAQNFVQGMAGVKGVVNLIKVVPKLAAVDVKLAIESAFRRSALLDAEAIQVETSPHKVTLRGEVRNYVEREEAERVAWAAPGVFAVENRIEVRWPWGSDNE
jgi:osmotically-inducible protein OsmY